LERSLRSQEIAKTLATETQRHGAKLSLYDHDCRNR